MRRAVATLAALAALGGGCRSRPATQLLVVVGTNIPVGSSLQTIEIEIRDAAGATVLGQRTINVSSTPMPPLTVAMPFSFGVVPEGGDATRRLRLIARGRFRESMLRDRVVLTAITGFVEHQKLLLPMLLDQRCVDAPSCADGFTCIEGTCQSAQVDPRTLQPADPDAPISLTSLFDAATADVAADVPPDAAVDAPAIDAPDAAVDAPAIDAPDAAVDAPSVDVPSIDVPSIDAPTLDVPSVDVPSVDVPSVDVPMAALRLLSPLTATELMNGRPTLRWKGDIAAGARVSLVFCRARDCSGTPRVIPVTTSPSAGEWAFLLAPGDALAAGPWWWTVRVDDRPIADPWWFNVPTGRAPALGGGAPWRNLADPDGDARVAMLVGEPLIDGVGTAAFDAEAALVAPGRPGGFAYRLRGPAGGPSPRYASGVTVAGDLDGDGRTDFAVAETGQAVHVYRSPLPGDPRATDGVVSLRDAAGMEFGTAVAGVGDIQRDGYADLAVSAQTSAGSGLVWVYRGGRAGVSGAVRDPLMPPGAVGARYGRSLAGAGDINGDERSDVIVGDPDNQRVYLFVGGLRPVITLGPPPGWSGTFGEAVAGAGDVNGDGFGDVVVTGDAAAVVFLGDAEGALARFVRPELAGAMCPSGLGGAGALGAAGVGDVNGDGFDDVIVARQGVCAAVFRGGAAAGPMVALTAVPTVPTETRFAAAVAGVGDLDGDGLADFAIGVPTSAIATPPPPGTVRVWWGRATWPATSSTPSWEPIGTNPGFGLRLGR